jgi:uncharacterized protein YlxW (UPF0749 family)
VDQCDILLNELQLLLTSFILSEKEMAFFAVEFAQQKEAEQVRRAKQAENEEKKEARKKKNNVNPSISCEHLVVSNIVCAVR